LTDVGETASTASAAIHGVKRIFTSWWKDADPDQEPDYGSGSQMITDPVSGGPKYGGSGTLLIFHVINYWSIDRRWWNGLHSLGSHTRGQEDLHQLSWSRSGSVQMITDPDPEHYSLSFFTLFINYWSIFTDVAETASTASAAIHGVKRIFTSCLERDPDPYTWLRIQFREAQKLTDPEHYRYSLSFFT
jgi:hypothetical protein